MPGETIDQYVERVIREYAEGVPPGPLSPAVLLKDELALESLALVSIAVRLAGDFGIDVVDFGLELGSIKTFGDLVEVAQTLERRSTTALAGGT